MVKDKIQSKKLPSVLVEHIYQPPTELQNFWTEIFAGIIVNSNHHFPFLVQMESAVVCRFSSF